MKRSMPEFMAVPLTLVGIGIVALILWAADAGLTTWLVVGAILLVVLVTVAVIAMRRPRGAAVGAEGSGSLEDAAPRMDDGVHRVLFIVDGVCETGELAALADGHERTSVFAVAPAVSSRVARWTGDQQAYGDANERLEATIRALEGAGIEASGHTAAHDPLQAADEALREFAADEIVFVLNRSEESEWLERGIVDLARARYSVPVREVTAAR